MLKINVCVVRGCQGYDDLVKNTNIIHLNMYK